MNCTHCGGVNPPDAIVCQFCGSELQEKEKVYIYPQATTTHDDRRSELKSEINTKSSRALALSMVGIIIGFIIIRVIFAVIALKLAKEATDTAGANGLEPPSSARTAKIISIISIGLAFMCAMLFIGWILTSILSNSYI